MGNSVQKRHYETAEKTGVLNLSKSKITEFPKKISSLSSVLRTLDLSDNSLATLPPDLGSFSQLKSISFNNNKLLALPEEIGNLSRLETFSFTNNRIQSLPLSVIQLINLKYVYLSSNQFKDFPVAFCGLKHLEVIDLSNNLIESVPSEVGGIRAAELILNQNRISTLCDEIADCPRLKTLRLEENCLQISAIPKRLLSESKVSLLTLEGNLFEMKMFTNMEGYECYMERFTAVKKKMC